MRLFVSVGVVSLLAAGAASAQTGKFNCGDGQTMQAAAGRTSVLGREVVGLTADQQLVCFPDVLPSFSLVIGPISGLAGSDTRIVGIDYRPASTELYGLGDAGGVYTLDASTGAADFKTRLDTPLSGNVFGIDFNPTVDLLRIVSDTGQNLRANVVTGVTTTDSALNTPPTAGTTLGVSAAAYTNNDLDATTATTLFVLNTTTDRVLIQAPPNNGTLNPTGNLRADAGSAAGFDIHTSLVNGVASDVTAYAALTVGGRARFYGVNLLTGEASLRGTFRLAHQVVDIAVPVKQN